MFLAAKEFPLPVEYRFLPARGGLPRAAGRRGGPDGGFPRLREHRPHARRLPAAATTRGSSTSTTTTTTPASATVNLVDTGASCTAEIVFALAKLLGRRDHAGDRDRALRRRWSPTPVASCTRTRPRLPPDGGRADRGGRRRPRHLPTPLRAGPDREASPRSRGRSSASSASTSAGSPSPTSPPADYAETGAERVAHRGHHRLTCGPSRAPRSPRWSATRRDGGRVRAQGEPALDGRARSTSPRSRASTAAAAILARPASRPTCRTTSSSRSSAPR